MVFLENRVRVGRNDYKDLVYVQIILFGLNYSFKEVYVRGVAERQVRFCLQYADDIWLDIPEDFAFMTFKRRLVLYGDRRLLSGFVRRVLFLREVNIYTGKGLRLRGRRFVKKPGKVKRR